MRTLFRRIFLGILTAVTLCTSLFVFLAWQENGLRPTEVLSTYMYAAELLTEQAIGTKTGQARRAAVDEVSDALPFEVTLVDEAPPEVTAALTAHGRTSVVSPLREPIAYRQLGDGTVLVFGPGPRLFRHDPRWYITLWLGTAVIIAVITTWLIRPVAQDLQAVEQAVGRIGAGDLTARAQVRSGGPVSQLATGIHDMAGRMGGLIEGQRQLMRAVSHELRTPNARIRFTLELLADASPEQRAEHIRSIDEDVDQVDELLDELLTYMRLDHGHTPARTAIDAGPAVEALATRLAPLADGVDISIEGSGTVHAEPRLFERAMANLLTNALRHATTRVVVRWDEDADTPTTHVDDDGDGVPPQERERILQPFVSLDSVGPTGGAGLGLAIVHRIAKVHGGTLGVSTSPLGGARFTVTWPGEPTGSA